MNTQINISIILFCLLFIVPSAIYSDVVSGIGTLNLGGWDFSDSTTVPYAECHDGIPPTPDIFLALVLDPPLGWIVGTCFSKIVMLPDSSYEDLRYAPEDTSMYNIWESAYLDITYVVRTNENHYAKFRFLQLPHDLPIIEYVYQPDGSRKLFDPVAIESYTWSSIKKIFR